MINGDIVSIFSSLLIYHFITISIFSAIVFWPLLSLSLNDEVLSLSSQKWMVTDDLKPCSVKVDGNLMALVEKIRPFLSLYWTNESKTEIESLRRLLHIWLRTFESIIIRISLFWFSLEGKQFCSIKIISLKGSSGSDNRFVSNSKLFFSLMWQSLWQSFDNRCDNQLIEFRSPN